MCHQMAHRVGLLITALLLSGWRDSQNLCLIN